MHRHDDPHGEAVDDPRARAHDEPAHPAPHPSADAPGAAPDGATGHHFAGTAYGPVLQLRDVHGDIRIDAPARDPYRVPHQVPPPYRLFENRAGELADADACLTVRPPAPGAEQENESGPGPGTGPGSGPRPTGTTPSTPEPPPVYVVHGPPGVGKTAFLRQWAARAAAQGRFPGGEFWVDYRALREQSAGGADVAEALSQCLRATGVEDTYLPGSVHELSNRFRSRTAERGVLLLLDEVSEPAQVRALLPNSPGSAVLVAGRSRLSELVDFDGAYAGPLGPLDARHGRALLTARLAATGRRGGRGPAANGRGPGTGGHGPDEGNRRLDEDSRRPDGSSHEPAANGRGPGAGGVRNRALERLEQDPEAVAEIVERCGGLPVALHVAAARLARPGTSPRALATELADEPRRLAALAASPTQGEPTVSAVFSVAYSDLTAEAARLYRLLGLFPGRSVHTGTAVCVAGADPETAEELLDMLEEAALLEWDEEDGRFRFHDLVRLHARECAMREESEQEREAVLERCLDYYVTGAAFADLAVMGDRLRIGGEAARRPGAYDPFEGPERRRAALAWLAAEREDALAVLSAAAGHGGHAHQVWQLAESLVALYLNHRHLADWRVCCELGAEAAAEDGRRDAEARLRALLSRPLLDTGEDARAREELDRALTCADETDNVLLLASVTEFDGRYWDRHDPVRALASYERSLALNEEAGNARGGAIARFFLGRALHATGAYQRALAELRAAEEEFAALGDHRMGARALAALAATREALGEDEAAHEAYEAAVAALRATQATHYEAEALEAWAALSARTGTEPGAVRARLARALEIYEAGGSPRADLLRERLAEQ